MSENKQPPEDKNSEIARQENPVRESHKPESNLQKIPKQIPDNPNEENPNPMDSIQEIIDLVDSIHENSRQANPKQIDPKHEVSRRPRGRKIKVSLIVLGITALLVALPFIYIALTPAAPESGRVTFTDASLGERFAGSGM